MKICVVGHTGFVGSAVFELLLKSKVIKEVVGMNSKSPNFNTKIFDVLVNCAGNSLKYLAVKSFNNAYKIDRKVIERLKEVKYKYLIYISSIDAVGTTPYGIGKALIEDKLLQNENVLILRVGGLIGKGLKKNVVYDILNDKQIYFTEDSQFNFISTSELANIISLIISRKCLRGIMNVGANDSINVGKICALFNKIPLQYGNKQEKYIIDIARLEMFFQPKSSLFYLQEML